MIFPRKKISGDFFKTYELHKRLGKKQQNKTDQLIC
jgi:hypothetical protein